MNKVYLADFNYFNRYIQRNWNQNLEYTKGKNQEKTEARTQLLKLMNLVLDWNIKKLCTLNIYSKVMIMFKEFIYCVRLGKPMVNCRAGMHYYVQKTDYQNMDRSKYFLG